MKLFKKKGGKVVKTKSSPYFNNEGYPDPTAYHALKNIKQETELEEKVSDLVHVFKVICNLAGFEIIGRISFKHKKTRKEFR
jgi:hypothetical protein